MTNPPPAGLVIFVAIDKVTRGFVLYALLEGIDHADAVTVMQGRQRPIEAPLDSVGPDEDSAGGKVHRPSCEIALPISIVVGQEVLVGHPPEAAGGLPMRFVIVGCGFGGREEKVGGITVFDGPVRPPFFPGGVTPAEKQGHVLFGGRRVA